MASEQQTPPPHPMSIGRAESVITTLIDRYSFERIKERGTAHAFPASMTYTEYKQEIFNRLVSDPGLAASVQTVIGYDVCQFLDLESCCEKPMMMFYINLTTDNIVYCCDQ